MAKAGNDQWNKSETGNNTSMLLNRIESRSLLFCYTPLFDNENSHTCKTEIHTGHNSCYMHVDYIYNRHLVNMSTNHSLYYRVWYMTWWEWLTHWGRVTHICVCKLTIIGSDNGLSPGRHQAIIWTNPGILLIGPLRRNFNDILIDIHTLSFKEIDLKMLSWKWRPFYPGLNVLRHILYRKRTRNIYSRRVDTSRSL